MRTRKVFVVAAALFLAIAAVWIFVSIQNRRSAIATTLTWARLAAFPPSAHDLQVRAEGSMFTRAFRIQFTAAPEEIQQWLSTSDGTREAQVEQPTPTTRHYSIKPGAKAQHAEVNVDDTTHTVSIYVYWS